MKNIITKIALFTLALAFAAGCATVTDANIDLPEEEKPSFEISSTEGITWDTRNGDDMDPIVDRPKLPGSVLD